MAGCVGRHRRAQHRLVGGLRQLRLRSPTATRSTAAGRCPRSPGRIPAPRPGEVDVGRRLPARAVALGGAQPALRRGAGPRPRLRLRLLPAGRAPPGRKVVTADLRVDPPPAAGARRATTSRGSRPTSRLAEKWDGADARRRARGRADWKARARRAEAEREAARTLAYSNALELDAHMLELERALAEATRAVSWRLTAPLRALNAARPSMRCARPAVRRR